MIEKLNISIENWCCYLKIVILIHSGPKYYKQCNMAIQIVHLSYHAWFLREPLNVCQAWHGNVIKQSGKCVTTAGLKTVEYRCSTCHKSCRTAHGLVLHDGLHRGGYPKLLGVASLATVI